MAEATEEETHSLTPKPSDWLTHLLSLPSDIIHTCVLSLTSPIFSLFSLASDSYHEAEETAAATVDTAIHKVPSKITQSGAFMARKIGLGLVGALQVGMMLMALMVAAAAMGVGLVEMWVEEPLVVRERLYFDYTKMNPEAVYVAGGGGSDDGGGGDRLLLGSEKSGKRSKPIGVPAGHSFQVSLDLLMPESDFNRETGIFQLTAELLSSKGEIIAKSSRPCMLPYQSLLVRLTRTFLTGVPCLFGIIDENQKLTVKILKHKELGHRRTEAIRVILSPRAGTFYLPQIYESEIHLRSHLPWLKEFVYNWKWTFYVWSSLYIYIILVIALLACCKTLFFPATTRDANHQGLDRDEQIEYLREPRKGVSSGEVIRRWKHKSRRKRKAASILHDDENDEHAASILHDDENDEHPEAASSALSMSTSTKVRSSAVVVDDDDDDQEGVGDSESVCN